MNADKGTLLVFLNSMEPNQYVLTMCIEAERNQENPNHKKDNVIKHARNLLKLKKRK